MTYHNKGKCLGKLNMASFHLWDTPCLLLGIHSHSTNSTKLGSEDKKKWVWHVLHYTGLIVLRRSITSRRIQRERWLHWWFIGGREGDYRKREVNSIKQISYREAYPNRAPDRWILFRMKGCSFLMDTLLSSCTDEKGKVQGAFLTYLKKASKLRKERVWTGIFSPKPAHTSGRSPPLSKKSWVSIRIKSIQQEQTWKGWLPMQLKHQFEFSVYFNISISYEGFCDYCTESNGVARVCHTPASALSSMP